MASSLEDDFTEIPFIRCITCNKVLGHLQEKYKQRLEEGEEPKKIFQSFGLKRVCCMARLTGGQICLPPGVINYTAQCQEDVDKMIETYLVDTSKKTTLSSLTLLPAKLSSLARIGSKNTSVPSVVTSAAPPPDEKKTKLNRFSLKRCYLGTGGLAGTTQFHTVLMDRNEARNDLPPKPSSQQQVETEPVQEQVLSEGKQEEEVEVVEKKKEISTKKAEAVKLLERFKKPATPKKNYD